MTYDHPYYQKSKKSQTKIQVLVACSALLLISLSLYLSILSDFYLLTLLVFSITLSIIAPFFDTPAGVRNGKLIYYSPLFLAEPEKKGKIKIHGGTLFDYVFVIDQQMSGGMRTRFIIQKYLEGLLNLIAEYEHKADQKIMITGTSYILNERTAKKMGFRLVSTDPIQKILLVYNYFNILISSSIAKGRLSFPNMNRIITVEATLVELLRNKPYMSKFYERLKDH